MRPILTLALLLALASPACLGSDPMTLRYEVEPVPGTGFVVRAEMSGLRGRRPELRMLDGWGVLQEMGGRVGDLQISDADGNTVGWELRHDRDEARWRLDRRPSEPVRLTYQVRNYDPASSPEASFTLADRFVTLGYSVFVIPGRRDPFAPADIEVVYTPPADWPVWTSWPDQAGVSDPPTAHDLWAGVAAGGAFQESRMGTGPVRVTVLAGPGIGRATALSTANRLIPALREMVEWFGQPPRGDALDVLALYRVLPETEGRSIMTGTSEENAFLCLATADRYRDPGPLTVMAVHECLHFFLGGAVTAAPEPPFRNAPELTWLMEGVTEYLTYRMLDDAGLMGAQTRRDVDQQKRRELAGWTDGLTLADAARRMDDMAVYSMVYARGYLVAQALDQELTARCGPGTLQTVLRDLLADYNVHHGAGAVDRRAVHAAFEARCPGSSAWIERVAEGSDPVPSATFAGAGATVRANERPR